MEPTEYPAMSGSNTICVATVLLEEGLVPMIEPETVVRLEAPAGPVEVRARCRDGRVESVELENVPSFPAHLGAPLEVEGLGTIDVDVAFGGMWYAIADAHALGFALEPAEARELCDVGERIRVAAREQLVCVHPGEPGHRRRLDRAARRAVPRRRRDDAERGRRRPGRLDRSATGTGLSARLAVLHARGLVGVGEGIAHASVIGSVFEGRIVREAAARHRAGDPRQRVRHRPTRAVRRPARPVPGGLPPPGHVAGVRRAVGGPGVRHRF